MKTIESEISITENRPVIDAKILVVDDREDNLLSIESILEKEGYTIVKANSGKAALKLLLKEQDFSLILMDVQMPQMNGLETAHLIYERDRLKHIPIIFITAHRYGEDLMFRGFKMGGVDYIHKPVDPALLRFKVGVFVELYQKTKELISQEEKLRSANSYLESEIAERRISEERINQLNKQLVKNNEELQQINHELDRFAFVASHDLQEPLRKILIFNDLISSNLDSANTETIRSHLEKIKKATGRMQVLINDLLAYSRHIQTIDHFEMTDLNELLADVTSDLEIEIKKTNASVNVERLPSLVVIPTQMRQLFQNLISNSIKFASPGIYPGIQIWSECMESSDPSKTPQGVSKLPQGPLRIYNIMIRDNGIGFDQKFAEDIFVVFKRLHSYHQIEGTGIGLSICKKIAELHHGEIRAESIPGKGSTFVISLPEFKPAS
jgi:signal transduction histidine kinase